jgi:hypothetical protein
MMTFGQFSKTKSFFFGDNILIIEEFEGEFEPQGKNTHPVFVSCEIKIDVWKYIWDMIMGWAQFGQKSGPP